MKKKLPRGIQILGYICYGILGIALICFVGFLLRYRIPHKPFQINPENLVRYIEITGTVRYGEEEKKYEYVLWGQEEKQEFLTLVNRIRARRIEGGYTESDPLYRSSIRITYNNGGLPVDYYVITGDQIKVGDGSEPLYRMKEEDYADWTTYIEMLCDTRPNSKMLNSTTYEMLYIERENMHTVEDFEKLELGITLEELYEQMGEPDLWLGYGMLSPAYCVEGDQVIGVNFKYHAQVADDELIGIVLLYDENGESRVLKEADPEPLHFNESLVPNIEEAYRDFTFPEHMSRQITIGNYSEHVPEELQELLVILNGDTEDSQEADWQRYEAECDVIDWNDLHEDTVDAPMEAILQEARMHYSFGAITDDVRVLDIDGDGEKEYIFGGWQGTGHYVTLLVLKQSKDGIVELYEHVAEHRGGYYSPKTAVLSYEGIDYLLAGDQLAYFDTDIETEVQADLYEEDRMETASSTDWITVTIDKKAAGYVPYEVYSNAPMIDPAVDYLKDVNLTQLEENDRELYQGTYLEGYYDIQDSWEQEYNGECYLYIISEICGAPLRLSDSAYDKSLMILRDTETGNEVIKVYYLAADYDIELKEQ